MQEAHDAFDAIEFAVQQHAAAIVRAMRPSDAAPEVPIKLTQGVAAERAAFDVDLADVVQLVQLQGFPHIDAAQDDKAWDHLMPLAHQTLVRPLPLDCPSELQS